MNYFEMYRDVWQFHKNHIDSITDRNEFWESVAKEAIAISKKYGECEFIVELLLVELSEFERIYKEMKNNADTGI